MIHDHPMFLRGLAEFQAGQFYPCHDTLEALWMDAIEPDKTFIQGILQLAVACYHLSNSNQRGSMILLGEGIKRLRDYQPIYETVNVETLVQDSAALLSCIQRLDASSLPTVVDWVNTASPGDELQLVGLDQPIQLPRLRRVYEDSAP